MINSIDGHMHNLWHMHKTDYRDILFWNIENAKLSMISCFWYYGRVSLYSSFGIVISPNIVPLQKSQYYAWPPLTSFGSKFETLWQSSTKLTARL